MAPTPGRSLFTSADAEDGGDAPRPAPWTDAIGATEPVICACFGVGVAAIRQAVAGGAARTVAEIGRTLRAGTNCGSCLPELKRIIVHERVAHSG